MSNPNLIPVHESRKRPEPSSPPPWQRPAKDHRRNQNQDRPRRLGGDHAQDDDISARKEQESFVREQTRLNQIQEAEQMREWVSKEDDFVLQQSKKKAHIRVREGRAKYIDWLAVTLGVIDPTRDPMEEDSNESDIDVVDPSGVFEGLDLPQLQELGKDIETYMALESSPSNCRYWKALKVICKDYQDKLAPAASRGYIISSISADVDRLLSPKSLAELENLEKQISRKLQSNEPIDVEYWEQLLRNVAVYKSRAELNTVYNNIIASRLNDLRHEQRAEAMLVRDKLALLTRISKPKDLRPDGTTSIADDSNTEPPHLSYSRELDPEPLLKLRAEDKGLDTIDEKDFLDKLASERQRVLKLKYVPLRQAQSDKKVPVAASKTAEATTSSASRFATVPNEDFSSATKALYEREVARGVQEDEEIFAGEEDLSSSSKPQWASKYRPRKPRYFNRVQMGYEWNKYNQTHYDHDNPPPKVVQGYKFNVFYPDLIDKTKAPTYRIERENGRKRGESFAPAGEEDTCLIRFISGPPYEDLAFRIVDKEWDYSAKRERGFRSSFDKGILQLHFQFKKVYYRK
ncbi:MAG: hypothetical protein ASARMPRED_004647 [Alectoria sarmentosa]|nr:MAG: hypothetical protein ASARMPRED_004647 [Alectoria sarmentosa]